MAYAALNSLMLSLEQIKLCPSTCLFPDEEEHFASLHEKLGDLQEFLEKLSPKGNETTTCLQRRIVDLAYKAEGLADMLLINEMPENVDWQNIIDEFDSIILEATTIKETLGSDITRDETTKQPWNSSRAGSSKISRVNTLIVGLDDESRQIKDQLTGHPSVLKIISIVGMGGIGKTTLATNIYTDPSIVYHFDIRAWATVSQSYCVRDIMLSILDVINLTDERHQESDDELGLHLYKTLKEFTSAAASEWTFSQIFGDKLPGEDVQNIDILSAVEFDKNGNHLAVGDRGGRIVIFENNGGQDESLACTPRNEVERLDYVVSKHPKYRYKTEFQSHEPEFDSLKSIEIEEKINKVRWCTTPNGSLFILSTNDKTIKLWKVKEHKVKQVKEMDMSLSVSSENSLLAERSFVNGKTPYIVNGRSLEWKENMANGVSSFNGGHDKIACLADPNHARCRKVYAHAHDFNMNSVSINSDGETFLSGDDLRINLWNLEISNQCFNIIDMKPENMEDLTEVITSAEFHPFHCNLLAYSSSRGFIRLADMRLSALCDHSAKILKDESHGPKSFFTEIIASITDLKFANDGKHILSRDYMNLKLWDIRMDTCPVATFRIHEHLRPKLCDLYNNDAIFDKFDCCLAGDGLSFATGSYGNLLRLFSYGIGNEEGVTIEAGKNTNRKSHLQPTPKLRRSSLSNLTRGFSRQGSIGFSSDFNSKLLHLAWHPTTNLIACAAANTLFMYHA